ncbi:hypothetical protein F66182_15057 [Fusarium sp. NRRL 66182]|nr:hypothetical protein F66182_15057 [Fusarium sp. NRRL 66182]
MVPAISLIIAMVIATVSAGFLIKRIGYYTLVMIAGICILSVGAALLTTLQIHTSAAKRVGYQILHGCIIDPSFQTEQGACVNHQIQSLSWFFAKGLMLINIIEIL